MARIFITGSTDGLGLATARTLINDGHQVLLHARSTERAATLDQVAPEAAGIVIGDLSSAAETRNLAEQVNAHGLMDAIVHNAGVYLSPGRVATPEGHSRTLAVNVLAPYILTALIERPGRLIYVSSGMHRGAGNNLRDIDWTERRWNASAAYSESKLHVSALSAAVARHWPTVLSNSVDPGWVPTRMGGASAPDDLAMGHDTQGWLAVSNDGAALVSGKYWHHRRQRNPAPEVTDNDFQDRLIDKLAELTGIPLF
ncbi:NAD(P)-dependent dehydrogenase (short-subunit alcohol dehydrogenase family) [Arthrobacter ginsengisoli]|uniref:NAD(P)-dependent dehydrogenase (Short-subunit alcohol dehydrogenase family) n=1 Tax=Arthrobacter ginsengisoli TaxID=1356565 RepID=A0ABU1UIH2_9MICC|nr:SDR family NAD(P)-dependent oxidoreductase [Arthrobacter ginsengisoli]MDR7084953.1 NAD(P)-dependent dehydrogenase (short-subunit alcohol dehydrogenase family) [Arthrobacter ginsengisoli]